MEPDFDKVADFALKMQKKGLNNELIAMLFVVYKDEFAKKTEIKYAYAPAGLSSCIMSNNFGRSGNSFFW